MKAKLQIGFTLMELMVTITFLAILMVIAAPSFTEMLKTNRLVSTNNTLVGLINSTRQLAISRGQTVMMCHTADESAATPTCGGSGSSWSQGVLIYVTTNSPSSLRSYAAATDEIIQRVRVNSLIDITADTDAANYIGFSSDGLVFEPSDTPVFALCDDRGEAYGKQLSINLVGQLRTSVPTSCTTPS